MVMKRARLLRSILEAPTMTAAIAQVEHRVRGPAA